MTGSHTGSQEWQSFEVRMRQRRLERCLIKADVALEEGFVADAREALEEARHLSPFAPELIDLDRRIAALEVVPAAEPEPAPRKHGRGSAVAATALLLVLAGAVGVWLRPAELRPLVPAGVIRPESIAPLSNVAPAPAPPSLTVATDSVTATQIRPELEPLPIGTTSAAESIHVASVGIAALPPIPEAAPSSVDPAAASATPPAPLPLVETTRIEPRRAEFRRDIPAVAPVTNLPHAAVPASPSAPAADPTPEATASGTANVIRADEQVRTVLGHYESAYSTLDATAAAAVYPQIDRAKLARAFDGLAAQRVALGSCSIQVAGAAASADCSGSATWEPKVGGGSRTQARRWHFELRQAGNRWQIVEARVR